MNGYFVIVSPKEDLLMYEADFLFQPDYVDPRPATLHGHSATAKDAMSTLTLLQFVAYGALDVVDLLYPRITQSYLKAIDSFGPQWAVSAYVLASNVRFVLVHDQRADEGIKQFFGDVQDAFVKLIQNPFYEPWLPLAPSLCLHGDRDESALPPPSMQRTLDECVRKAYKKHLQSV
jgi:hypothetical protein